MNKTAELLREKQTMYELISTKEHLEEVVWIELRKLEERIELSKKKIAELLCTPEHESLFKEI